MEEKKNENEMEEWKDVKKGQKTSPVAIVILVILLIAAIAAGLLCGDKLYGLVHPTEESNTKTEEKADKEEQKEQKEEVSIEDAEKVLVKFGLSNNSKLPAYLGVYTSLGYTEEFKIANAIALVEESKISSDICSRLYLGTDKADYITDQGPSYYREKDSKGVCNPADSVPTVKYNDVNEIYKDLYGTDAPKKGFAVGAGYYKFYDYYEENEEYVSLKCNGCGGAHGPFVQVIREVSLDDNVLTIKVAADYVNAVGPNTYSVGGETFTSEEGNMEKTVKENYVDKLKQFTITFTKDEDHYTFKNFEKIG